MLTRTSAWTREGTGAAIALLRDLVHEKTGLHYDEAHLEVLAHKLGPLAAEQGVPTLLDYYYLLKYDPAGASEWPRVIDALAVPETYFWREVEQLRAIVDVVVPAWAEVLCGRPLRIWSVPCSSGEEPLTIAMMLDQAGWFERAAIEIHASDASPQAIARARRGLYRERSFRAIPPELRDRYFRREGDLWRVDPALHERIRWSVANVMVAAEAAPLAAVPIIVCRNLFIYFSDQSIRRTVALFAERMPTPAYLCLGVSESLLRLNTEFQLEEVGRAFMYVRRAPSGDAWPSAS